jgi:serine/threonine-protein kinase RsbT
LEGHARIEIGSEADVVMASQQAGRLADELGFSRVERSHVVTATSEVAGNIWLYAGRGTVELATVDEPERAGITVVARDSGPGIADPEQARSDGWSSRGGMGMGLPGARRLMDDFWLSSEPGRGTTVTMARWRPKPGAALPEPPLVDWRPAEGADPDRRALMSAFRNGVLLAAVAGAGRGEDAARAAEAAAGVLASRPAGSPIDLVRLVHEELRGSRGVSLALASVSALDAHMTWLAVGAVEAELVRAAPMRQAIREAAPALRGSLGVSLPTPRASTVVVMRGDALALSSGGERLGEARFLRGAGERRPHVAR